MSIKPLPDDVIAQIKSSTVITSLNSVACGLLKNSLDAKATKVSIAVDYRRGSCSVEDDGCGIAPSEFSGADGGIGKLYYTSKHPYQPTVHGRYGTFLASVAALSLLTITSRHDKHRSYNYLSIHNSSILARHTPALPEQRLAALSHGTRVTVRDLFGSMPVRVKQRVAEAESSGYSKEWDQLMRHVLALLLAWHRDVVVTVKDSRTNDSVTFRGTDSLAGGKLSRPEKSQSLIPRSVRLFSQASLCDLNDIESWVSVGVSAPRYSINGCVSLIPVATRRAQFISLGTQPILDEFHSNVLYEEINKVFANSSFGVVEDGDDSETGKADGFTGRELKAKKGIDRWPMFYLRIIPGQSQSTTLGVNDVLDDGRHGLPVLIDLLKAVFYELLRKHHFRPHALRVGFDNGLPRPGSPRVLLSTDKSSGNASPSADGLESERPPKQRKLDRVQTPGRSSRESSSTASRTRNSRFEQLRSRSDSPFGTWSRVKSANPGVGLSPSVKLGADKVDASDTQEEGKASVTKQQTPVEPRAPPLIAKDGRLLRKPFGHSGLQNTSQKSDILSQPEHKPPGSEAPDTFVWENPRSKIKSIVNSRTGFVISPHPSTLAELPRRAKAPREPPHTRIDAKPSSEPTAWAKDLLSSWKNPVFETVEEAIPRLPDKADAPKADGDPTITGCKGCHSIDVPNADELRTVSVESRISRDNLFKAEVIAQVDKKFILAKVPVTQGKDSDPLETSHLLVLIDQHAADERCRVESMMADYFIQDSNDTRQTRWTARVSILDKPLHFDLSKQERKLLERFQPHFQHWGVFYEISPPGTGRDTGSPTRVTVRRLPPSIAERFRLEPKLLVDLIRKEIWKLEESGGVLPPISDNSAKSEEPLAWVARFHGCPQGILEMINSRACRSAIMFNDILSVAECKDLIARLVQCAFPFQCAHGRPSMVPIIDLGST